MPAKRAWLPVQREFTEQELEQIRPGFIPEHMEDKWWLLMEGNTLYIHRSWTGYCIYQVQLARQDTKYVTGEAFVNRDESQYAGTNDLYDEKQLVFLIEYLLLKKRSPLPVTVAAGIATELHHHHVLGAGTHTRDPGRNAIMAPALVHLVGQAITPA